MPDATKYGPIVQGNKNRVTKTPTKNAPEGEVIPLISFFTLGLSFIGISVARPPGLYLTASLIFKTPKTIATRVIMGYFETDEKQFLKAVDAIKNSGWIHYHTLVSRDDISQSEQFVKDVQREMEFQILEINTRKIKKYSPRQYHLCTDILIQKNKGKNL